MPNAKFVRILVPVLLGSVAGLGLGWFGLFFGAVFGYLLGDLAGSRWFSLSLEGFLQSGRTGRLSSRFHRIFSLSALAWYFSRLESPGISARQTALLGPYFDQVCTDAERPMARELAEQVGSVGGPVEFDSIHKLLADDLVRRDAPDSSAENIVLWCYHFAGRRDRGMSPRAMEELVGLLDFLGGDLEQFLDLARQRWYPSREALEVLGLEGDPDPKRMKSRYRELAGLLHPDVGLSASGGAEVEAFLEVSRAKEVLDWQARLPWP